MALPAAESRLSLTEPSLAARLFAAMRERLLSVGPEEVRFSRRGFPDDVPGVRERLERCGLAFVSGYGAALREREPRRLARMLDATDADLSGFGYEGAAMALALVDLLTPWSTPRWRALFAERPAHVHLMLVGAGWALARLHRRMLPAFLRDADPLLWPLVWDGYGFHQGFFAPGKYVRRAVRPRLHDYALHAFDQGLGRSLWFVEGASAERIAATIGAFEPSRQGDLWSGAGLACGYAGGVGETAIRTLAHAGGGAFAQGIAFAAVAREHAGNTGEATRLACRTVWSADPPHVVRIAEEALDAARPGDAIPRYERWRRNLAARREE